MNENFIGMFDYAGICTIVILNDDCDFRNKEFWEINLECENYVITCFVKVIVRMKSKVI